MTDENNIAALNNERLAKIWNPGNVKMQTRNCKLQFAVCGFEWKTSCQRSLLSWSKLSARKNNPFGVYLLLWVFSKLQLFGIIFPKVFDAIYPFMNVRIFLIISISITVLNPKTLGFLFSMKNSLTLGVKCEKLSFRKS